jgi:hypothetical protein
MDTSADESRPLSLGPLHRLGDDPVGTGQHAGVVWAYLPVVVPGDVQADGGRPSTARLVARGPFVAPPRAIIGVAAVPAQVDARSVVGPGRHDFGRVTAIITSST